MTTLLEELHPATFKNVPFLVTGSNTSGGRKTITHEFVNSNERAVEDLGLLQKTFTLTGVVTGRNITTGKDTGTDYLQKRNSLIAALESAGDGVLVHPFFGSVLVVAKPYTLSENTSELGEAQFQLVFERSEKNLEPQAGASTTATVAKKAETLLEALQADVSDIYLVTKKFVRNATDAIEKLDEVGAIFETATSTIRTAASGLDNFKSTLRDFTENTNSLILAPIDLANSLGSLFETMEDTATSPIEFLELLAEFFDFGDDDTEILLTTVERVEREENRKLINSFIQCGSLAESYKFVVAVDFDTVDEIDAQQATLDAQYDAVVEDLPTATQVSLNEVRSDVRSFLDAQRISAKRVITIETQTTTVQALVYSLYGNLDNVEKIIELNNIKDVSFVEGQVQVLT